MSAVGQTGARANKNLIYWVIIILVFGSLVSAAIILDPGRAKLKLVASNTDREIVGCLYEDPKDTGKGYLPVVFDKSDGGRRPAHSHGRPQRNAGQYRIAQQTSKHKHQERPNTRQS